MANRKEVPNKDDGQALAKRSSPPGPLASILAEMLRSALAWEEEHGTLPQKLRSHHQNALTGISQEYILAPSKITMEGENDDHDDNSQKSQEAADL
jgi:hypothetical protein